MSTLHVILRLAKKSNGTGEKIKLRGREAPKSSTDSQVYLRLGTEIFTGRFAVILVHEWLSTMSVGVLSSDRYRTR